MTDTLVFLFLEELTMLVKRVTGGIAVVLFGLIAVSATATQPAAPPTAEPQQPVETSPAPLEVLTDDRCCDVAPAPTCPTPCITYHHRRIRKACYDPCAGMAEMVLAVKNPCSCCTVEVPVCVPVCCVDVPCVDSRCGLFGRGIVEYSWECGFRVLVVINKHGDVRVTYFHG
jgi:hypothetical protein